MDDGPRAVPRSAAFEQFAVQFAAQFASDVAHRRGGDAPARGERARVGVDRHAGAGLGLATCKGIFVVLYTHHDTHQ